MAHIAGILLFLLIAGTKILLAPGIMLAAGYGFVETIIITYSGALLGATVFYYFGVAIFKWLDEITGTKNSPRHIFSKKARAMVKVKIRYGIIGIAVLAPIISVPVSALIVAKFFPGKHKVIGIYAILFIPISIGLTFLSEPVIQPIVALVKHILHSN
jgi:membrane protein YqaA with SNARE-associated domain